MGVSKGLNAHDLWSKLMPSVDNRFGSKAIILSTRKLRFLLWGIPKEPTLSLSSLPLQFLRWRTP